VPRTTAAKAAAHWLEIGLSFALRPATFITKTRLNAVLFLGVLCGISDLHGYAMLLLSVFVTFV